MKKRFPSFFFLALVALLFPAGWVFAQNPPPAQQTPATQAPTVQPVAAQATAAQPAQQPPAAQPAATQAPAAQPAQQPLAAQAPPAPQAPAAQPVTQSPATQAPAAPPAPQMAAAALAAGMAPSPAAEKKAPRQVLITAGIVEWAHDSTLDYGFTLQYTKPAGDSQDFASAFAALPRQTRINQGTTLFLDRIRDDSGSYSGVISALEQLGSVKILSEPRVVVLCKKDYEEMCRDPATKPPTPPNLVAQVSSASKIPYETAQPAGTAMAQVTQFKDAAIQLTVSVEDILQDEFVKMKLNSSVTDLSGFVSVALNQKGDPLPTPQTFTRSIDNTVLVRDNTLFITGILKTSSKHTREQGVPWFSRIPVLGYLFKNHQDYKTDQELLFLVRPHVLRD